MAASQKPQPDEWEEVSGESPDRIIFDTVGDQFIGTFVGFDIINAGDEPFEVILLESREDGKLYQTSASYKLAQGIRKATPGQVVRITYVKDVPMGPGRNDMKDFTVDVKR